MYNALLRIEIEGEARVPKHTLFNLGSLSVLKGTQEAEVSRIYIKHRVIPDVARAVGVNPKAFTP